MLIYWNLFIYRTHLFIYGTQLFEGSTYVMADHYSKKNQFRKSSGCLLECCVDTVQLTALISFPPVFRCVVVVHPIYQCLNSRWGLLDFKVTLNFRLYCFQPDKEVFGSKCLYLEVLWQDQVINVIDIEPK